MKPARMAPCLLALAIPGLLQAATKQYDFDVLLDKRPIGTHRFAVLQEADGSVRIQSTAEFSVRLLGIPAYRYRHQSREQWRGGCLAAIEATTEDNGRDIRVAGRLGGERFQLEQPASTALPGCVSAYAYWNRDLLLRQSALLNPQTGQLDEVRIESLGSEPVTVAGRAVPAERYRLRAAKYVIDLWYSLRGDWLQLESSTGSRKLVYRLREHR